MENLPYITDCLDLRGRAKFKQVRACLHGGGEPQVGEGTRLGAVARLSM